MSSTSQIKKGALLSYFAIGVNILAGLLYTPWMIRQIGQADYGLYTLVTVFISYFLIDFGLGSAIGTFTAKYKARGEMEKVDRIIGISYKAYIFITALVATILAVCYFFLPDIFQKLTPEEIDKFKVIYCIGGLFSVCTFPFTPANGILIAYERFVVLKSADLLHKVLCVCLIVYCLLSGYGLYALVAVNGLVGLMIALFKFFYIKGHAHLKIDIFVRDRPLLKSIASFSGWVFVMGIAQRLILTSVPTILGILSGSVEIAVFAIAMTLEGYVWVFSSALNGLFIPRVSEFVARGVSREELTDLMIRVGRLQLYIIGVLILGIVVFGSYFISLWVGPAFHRSYWIALLIITPNIVVLTEEIANSLLWVENEVKYRALLFIGAGIMSCTVGSLLAPSLGALGPAIGIFFALILCHCIGLNVLYKRILRLDILRFFRCCHLRILPVILLPALLLLLLLHHIESISWSGLFLYGIVYLACEAAAIYFIAMNRDEKNLVRTFIPFLK